jgi:hypothetical protein
MQNRNNMLAYMFCIGLLIIVISGFFSGAQDSSRGVAKTLESNYVTTAPVLDGNGGDDAWTNAEAITTSNGVEIRSVYTTTHIYFMATWEDSTRDVAKNSWAFTGGEWKKSGDEDRLAFAWNIGNSVANFNENGCQVACHSNSMNTNADGEKIDAWHWKAARTDPAGYVDDKWWDNADTTDDHEASRHGDSRDSGSYSSNAQKLNNSIDVISVPMYYEPDATGDDAKFITSKEVDDGEAKMITGVDANGTLIYSGGSVPSSATIPGYVLEKPVGSRGDINVASSYAEDYWTVEISRGLDTTHDDDIQFSTSVDSAYYFGVATFDNSGGMNHDTTGSNVYKLVFVKDSDGDGVKDILDAFPDDATETKDTDGDGVGDNGDVFPNNANETTDKDSDGVGDNADAFPNNATETKDTDGDGRGDNGDAFPNDAAASVDSDDDGYPDEWNSGKTIDDSTTGLELDSFPDDASKWVEEEEDDGSDNTMLLLVLVVVIVVVILAVVMMMMKKKPDEPKED